MLIIIIIIKWWLTFPDLQFVCLKVSCFLILLFLVLKHFNYLLLDREKLRGGGAGKRQRDTPTVLLHHL